MCILDQSYVTWSCFIGRETDKVRNRIAIIGLAHHSVTSLKRLSNCCSSTKLGKKGPDIGSSLEVYMFGEWHALLWPGGEKGKPHLEVLLIWCQGSLTSRFFFCRCVSFSSSNSCKQGYTTKALWRRSLGSISFWERTVSLWKRRLLLMRTNEFISVTGTGFSASEKGTGNSRKTSLSSNGTSPFYSPMRSSFWPNSLLNFSNHSLEI